MMVHYSPTVWAVLREIYECTPAKTSVEHIRQRAVELLKTNDIPKRATIHTKIKKQAWQKIATKQCQLDSAELTDKVAQIRTNITALEQKNSSTLTVNKVVQLEKISERLGLFDERAFVERKSAAVILEHRKRSYKTGLLLDNIAQRMELALEQIQNFASYYDQNPDEFSDMDMAQAYTITLKRYEKIIDGVMAASTLASSATALAKLDFVLYGLNPDDVREPESDKRLIALMSDDTYYAKEQELLRLEEQKIAERMQKIQSGQFEAEVKHQAMQAIQKEQEDSECDDVDFDEIL